ncbi:DUF11 domain-containing protein [Nostoc sp. UCD121]|uniref:DUF11 domain-containing protein n=1 Tax=unclassified Nostoc TaxID=2593658 RepID=UPI0016284B99|nr:MULTISPECIES: DUF11 domain-containing protein [unclassified Nostoc]MBC1221453.1 DUF11 domain-containing protein [Nostoc sp. UCD120]MBC1276609.1 DUF11 domain-containing protein [Nostoc sp. UCD121]MBC1294164.1 DUF11 domain-containing protein [Nostoc sp. UCD122]
MKRFSFASLGAIALIVTVPFISQVPGIASLRHSTSAVAQNVKTQGQIQLRLEAEKQVIAQDQQGKQSKTWQPLKGQAVVRPGDVLRYTLSGENKSDRPVKNLILNQPIPKGMVYILKSAIATNETKVTYSIDGGRSFVENPTVKVTLPGGKVETKPAPANVYTHIRLQVPSVPAKKTVKAIYQVQVR